MMSGVSAIGALCRQSAFGHCTHSQQEERRICSRVGVVGMAGIPPGSDALAVKGSRQMWPGLACRCYIWGMDEKEALDRLGPPDEVISLADRMRSRSWVCSTCRCVVTSSVPIPVPAPCLECGGFIFETVR
jgi:hypothetical protein